MDVGTLQGGYPQPTIYAWGLCGEGSTLLYTRWGGAFLKKSFQKIWLAPQKCYTFGGWVGLVNTTYQVPRKEKKKC